MNVADSSLAWLPVAAAVIAVGVGVGWVVRRNKQRQALEAPLRARIDTSRTRLDELARRLAEGQITQDAHDEQARDIARDLLEPAGEPGPASTATPLRAGRRRWGALAGLGAVVAAGVWYLTDFKPPEPTQVAGAPNAAAGAASGAASGPARPLHPLSDEQLQRMIDQASAQVQKNPKDAASWAMLAHSYDMLGKFAESTKAYETLVKLVPGDAQVLADYADALAVSGGRTLRGEPTELIGRALAIDPNNLKALALSGTAAYERRDYAQAVVQWEHARSLSKDPAFLQQIDVSLASARDLSKWRTPAAPVAAASAAPAASGANSVSGRVTLADDLAKKAPADATVFIYARPVSGSRMPVALLRRHVRDLPFDFTLDDTMSMVKDVHLSQSGTVVIGARVSQRGDVAPQPGDMQGTSAPVALGSKGIKLEISEVLK